MTLGWSESILALLWHWPREVQRFNHSNPLTNHNIWLKWLPSSSLSSSSNEKEILSIPDRLSFSTLVANLQNAFHRKFRWKVQIEVSYKIEHNLISFETFFVSRIRLGYFRSFIEIEIKVWMKERECSRQLKVTWCRLRQAAVWTSKLSVTTAAQSWITAVPAACCMQQPRHPRHLLHIEPASNAQKNSFFSFVKVFSFFLSLLNADSYDDVIWQHYAWKGTRTHKCFKSRSNKMDLL